LVHRQPLRRHEVEGLHEGRQSRERPAGLLAGDTPKGQIARHSEATIQSPWEEGA
jgi:hypothetical protein